MATNRYFNLYRRGSEQSLAEDLMIEAIKMYGIDTLYLPRSLQKEDLIYGEDVVSKFDDYFDIEVYIKNVEGFDGQGDLFKKFGLEIQDQATLIISRNRFSQVVGTDLDPPRPKEGDLMFFPLNDALMEIKFVSNEKIFYQLGDWYVYQVEVQQFVYSHEDLATGISDIDNDQVDYTYQFDLQLGVGTGTYLSGEEVYQGASLATATAKAIVIHQDSVTDTLRIRNLVGEFQTGVNAIGNTSGATYLITSADDQNILEDASATNKKIEVDGDAIIDFSESNPFSEDDY